MKTTEIILVLVNDCFGYPDTEKTKSFSNSSDAETHAKKIITELAEINNCPVSDDDLESYIEDGYWQCSTDEHISVYINSITHYN